MIQDPPVEYLAAGELAALFYEGFTESIDNDGKLVLSARPNFIFRHGSSSESAWMTDGNEGAYKDLASSNSG